MKSLLLLTGILLSTFALPAFAQQCIADVAVGTPVVNYTNRIISGTGVRGPSCTTREEMVVYLKQDRKFWFDRTLATARQTGTNFTVLAQYHCKAGSGMRVYVEVRTRNRKVQSHRITANTCN